MNVYFYKLWCEFYHVVIILSNYLNINHFRAFNLLCFVKVRISEFSVRFDQVVFSNLVTHLRTGRGDDDSLAQTIPQQLPGEGIILLRSEKGGVWFRRSSSCADCCRWAL